MIRLDGDVVLVTGVGRGLGRAYARLLADRGAVVAVHDAGVDRDGSGGDPGPAQAVRHELERGGARASVHLHNLDTRAGCDGLIEEVLAEHGRIDALVHNAGIVRYDRIAETSVETWQRILAINIEAAWWLCRAVWPGMRDRRYGRIVLTTSGYGLRVVPGNDVTAYSVSKAAQFGLMNALAGEGHDHGVRVNAIAPIAATRIFRRDVAAGQLSPESVAAGVVLLASRDCPVNGTVLAGAGGRWSLQRLSSHGEHDLGGDATVEDVLIWARTIPY